MKKRIVFSVDESIYNKIEVKAESEGLDIANYCRHKTVTSLKDSGNWIPQQVSEDPCNNSAIVASLLEDIRHKSQEHFVVFTLNVKMKIIEKRIIAIGTLDGAMVHPREVFVNAITDRAFAIVVAHNHPSGDCAPSKADLKITETLVNAGTLLGIPVLDHIIVSHDTYKSLKSDNLM